MHDGEPGGAGVCGGTPSAVEWPVTGRFCLEAGDASASSSDVQWLSSSLGPFMTKRSLSARASLRTRRRRAVYDECAPSLGLPT